MKPGEMELEHTQGSTWKNNLYSLEFGDHTLLEPDFLLEKFEDGRMNLPRQEGKQRAQGS